MTRRPRPHGARRLFRGMLLAIFLLVSFPLALEARPVTWGGLFVGVQHVAIARQWSTYDDHEGLAVSALALWTLPRQQSLQVQVIQPVTANYRATLIRVAWDWRVF